MATSFDAVKDLALIIIRDYKLDKLYLRDRPKFQQYTDGILIRAIPKFTESITPLDYTLSERVFIHTLDPLEATILADWFVYTWFEINVNDITQVNLHLTNTDFKLNSEANNLQQKSEYLDRMREKIRQDSLDYQLKHMNVFDYFKDIVQ